MLYYSKIIKDMYVMQIFVKLFLYYIHFLIQIITFDAFQIELRCQ